MRFRYLTLALLIAAAPALAADPPPRTMTMSGQGIVKAVPDQASLSSGVVSEAKTAAEALCANADAMNAVFATLKKLGLPERAVQTSNFSLAPVYQDVKQAGATVQRLAGYRVSNTVTVTLDDIAKVGTVLDALVSAGSNQVGDIGFFLRDPAALLIKAREAAAKDAIARADTYARAAGVKLGSILAIQESSGALQQPLFRMDKAVMAAAAPTPVAGGEQSVSAEVTITWQLQQ
jgi:uncharacterized protein